jgi:hypothetical protein
VQAISTKYLGPTNARGSRIKATTASGLTKTIPFDYELDEAGNAKKAAKALMKKLGWEGKIACGSTKTGHCCVFVSSVRQRKRK